MAESYPLSFSVGFGIKDVYLATFGPTPHLHNTHTRGIMDELSEQLTILMIMSLAHCIVDRKDDGNATIEVTVLELLFSSY